MSLTSHPHPLHSSTLTHTKGLVGPRQPALCAPTVFLNLSISMLNMAGRHWWAEGAASTGPWHSVVGWWVMLPTGRSWRRARNAARGGIYHLLPFINNRSSFQNQVEEWYGLLLEEDPWPRDPKDSSGVMKEVDIYCYHHRHKYRSKLTLQKIFLQFPNHV